MIEKNKKSERKPYLSIKKLCLIMDKNDERTVAPLPSDDVSSATWGYRHKRHVKKRITLLHVLKVICASRESCLDWLKNKGLIPRIMFCPNCSKKMKFEANEEAIDGYFWICRECPEDPPQFSSRHGSWLQSKDAPLVDILLFTYLWSHGFTEEQISKEMNMPASVVQEWNVVYSTICDSLHQRSSSDDGDAPDRNSHENMQESPTSLWRKKNIYKDSFFEFLKDADSL